MTSARRPDRAAAAIEPDMITLAFACRALQPQQLLRVLPSDLCPGLVIDFEMIEPGARLLIALIGVIAAPHHLLLQRDLAWEVRRPGRERRAAFDKESVIMRSPLAVI
jgi:hypothetical protein